jgi:hypothetical protein
MAENVEDKLIRTDNPDWNDLAANWYPEMASNNGSPGQAGDDE